MSVNSTEGGTFIGIVVEGDDNLPDPYGMGRVKVLCPSIHHKDITTNELPWCILASNPDATGSYTHNRPPPVGSIVEVFYAPGTKSSGYGVIRSVINGVHNTDPQKFIGEDPTRSDGLGENLSQNGYIKKARNKRPSKASGPSTQIQSAKGFAMQGARTDYKPFPTMNEREGQDSSLSSKGYIRTNKGFQSISKAEQWVHFTYDTGVSGLGLQPITYIKSQDYEMKPELAENMKNKLLKAGFENFAKYSALRYITDQDSTNFSNESSRTTDMLKKADELEQGKKYKIITLGTTDFRLVGAKENKIGVVFEALRAGEGTGTAKEGWSVEVDEALAKVKTHKDLQDTMHKIQTREFLLGPKEDGEPSSVDTPFGSMTRTPKKNGLVVFSGYSSCNQQKWQFIKSTVNKLPTARIDVDSEGGLFKDSLVPGDTMLRIKPDSAKTIKETIQTLSDGKSMDLGLFFKRYHGGEHITRGGN